MSGVCGRGEDGSGRVTPHDPHPGGYPCSRGLAVCLAFGGASLGRLLGPMQRGVPEFSWSLEKAGGQAAWLGLGEVVGNTSPAAGPGAGEGVTWEAKVKVTHRSPRLVSLQSLADICLLIVSSKISRTVPSLAFHPKLCLSGFLTHSSPSTVRWVIHSGEWFLPPEAGHPPCPRRRCFSPCAQSFGDIRPCRITSCRPPSLICLPPPVTPHRAPQPPLSAGFATLMMSAPCIQNSLWASFVRFLKLLIPIRPIIIFGLTGRHLHCYVFDANI